MAFEIIVHEAAVEELEALRVFDQRKLVAAKGEQLSHNCMHVRAVRRKKPTQRTEDIT